MKMLGSISSSALRDLISGLEQQIGKDCRPNDMLVSIPRDVLVALYHEYQEAMTCHFYYELGRSIRLEESQVTAREKIPSKYLMHFDLGVKDREAIEHAEEKCSHCNKLGYHMLIPRGRLARRIKEAHENADRQQEVKV